MFIKYIIRSNMLVVEKVSSALEMSGIMVYEHPLFGKVRMYVENGKSWFCGMDIATSLQYSNPSKAIIDHCKPASITIREVGVQTGLKADGTPAIQMKSMKFISEGNIYRLITKSQMPKADEFESWIFDEIVPSVVNTGSYSLHSQYNVPQSFGEALMLAAQQQMKIEEQQKQIEQKTEQLDESKEWYSIKRWAKEHNMNWRSINWRRMKALSYGLGYEIKKIFDANYGQVNIYHINVFKTYLNERRNLQFYQRAHDDTYCAYSLVYCGYNGGYVSRPYHGSNESQATGGGKNIHGV
jgi:prophage antirepressor-like protein